jgi:hypothetical protein
MLVVFDKAAFTVGADLLGAVETISTSITLRNTPFGGASYLTWRKKLWT